MGRKFLKKKIILFALLLTLASACSSFERMIRPDPSEFTNVVFDIPFDETWEAIQDVTRSESLPLNIVDKELGVIETQKILEFDKKILYRQYIAFYAEVKKLSENFTSVSVSYSITRYNPVTHEWGPVSGTGRQKKFLAKVRAVLETG